MSRNVATPMITQITGTTGFMPCILVDLQFHSSNAYVWSGIGNVTWNGNTYAGVGSLGSVGDVKEGLEVRADGTSVTLSGIDSTLLNESLTDIQIGAPATIWMGMLNNGAIVDSPYPMYKGTVDKPTIGMGSETVSITLNLETRMVNLQRATNRRYTAADQMIAHPDDIAFTWVERLNDGAWRWG